MKRLLKVDDGSAVFKNKKGNKNKKVEREENFFDVSFDICAHCALRSLL